MRHYEEDLVQSLYNLYFIYQEYMLNHNNIKLDVLIQNKMINFKLYDDIELIDEFGLSFKEKEYDIYSYVCLRIMIMLFSEKRIYNGHNIIYNRIDNPDIKLEINDDVILRMILGVIISYSGNIEVHIDSILNLQQQLRFRMYPRKIMKSLDERISLSRKLLRMDDVK